MPRTARAVADHAIYHVLNRGNGRMKIFHKPPDYDAFLKLLRQARDHAAVDLLAFCLMPNHWHLVLRPRRARELSRYMRWLTTAHVRRHHAHYHSDPGHLYQGRYKSFPVQSDTHLLTLLRYVEANALRSGLTKHADGWNWSSHTIRSNGDKQKILSAWPMEVPRDWASLLEATIPAPELDQLRTSVKRGRPFGTQQWTQQTARTLRLSHTIRPVGRPKSTRGTTKL